MAIVQGKVSKISKKRVGSGFAYAFVLEDGDTWYRMGFEEPKFEEGYVVRFDDSPVNKYGQIDTESVKFKAGEPTVNKQSPKQAYNNNSGNSGGSKENWDARAKYWEEKDKQDLVKNEQYNFRSAFHVAVELINKGIELEVLTIGTPKASNPKKWQAYLTMIDGLAADIHNKFLVAGAVDNAAEASPELDDEPFAEEAKGDDDWEDVEPLKASQKKQAVVDDDWDD